MIDNRTPRLDLPLPHIDNYLEDDVARLREALGTLDEKVATIDGEGANGDIKKLTGLVGPMKLGADGEELLDAVTIRQFKERTDYLYEAAPFPDVWAPLNDDLRLLAGIAPYDRLYIGAQYVELPTKSLNFSRATAATYIDKSGVLQTAAINEPRFEKDGLLIEGEATNYYCYSNDPANWSNASNYTKTVGPDGITQAQTFKCVTTADGTDVLVIGDTSKSVISLAAGEVCTVSFRVKGTGCRIRIRIVNGSGVLVGDATVDLVTGATTQNTGITNVLKCELDSDGYYSVVCNITAATSDNFAFQLRGLSRQGQTTIPAGSEINLQMPQLERGRFKTSFIITGAAAATRASDVLYLDQKNGGLQNVTIACNVSRLWPASGVPNTAPRIVSTRGATPANAWEVAFNATGLQVNSFGGQTNGGSLVSGFIDGQVVASVKTPTGLRTIIPAGELSGAQVTASGFVSPLYIGNTKEANRPLFGHIRNLRIWHSVLSDNQIKGLR